MDAFTLHTVAHFLYRIKVPFVPKLFQVLIFFLFNSYIPYELRLGKGTKIGHRGIGVVINKRTIIGESCLIRAHVTIGGRAGGSPVIGNNVEIGDGAKILGHVFIGDYAKIGANAVVLKDVPPYSTAVGVPARVIAKNDK